MAMTVEAPLPIIILQRLFIVVVVVVIVAEACVDGEAVVEVAVATVGGTGEGVGNSRVGEGGRHEFVTIIDTVATETSIVVPEALSVLVAVVRHHHLWG